MSENHSIFEVHDPKENSEIKEHELPEDSFTGHISENFDQRVRSQIRDRSSQTIFSPKTKPPRLPSSGIFRQHRRLQRRLSEERESAAALRGSAAAASYQEAEGTELFRSREQRNDRQIDASSSILPKKDFAQSISQLFISPYDSMRGLIHSRGDSYADRAYNQLIQNAEVVGRNGFRIASAVRNKGKGTHPDEISISGQVLASVSDAAASAISVYDDDVGSETVRVTQKTAAESKRVIEKTQQITKYFQRLRRQKAVQTASQTASNTFSAAGTTASGTAATASGGTVAAGIAAVIAVILVVIFLLVFLILSAAVVPAVSLKADDVSLNSAYEYITELDAKLTEDVRSQAGAVYLYNGVPVSEITIETNAAAMLTFLDIQHDDYDFSDVKAEIQAIHSALHNVFITTQTIETTDPETGDTIETTQTVVEVNSQSVSNYIFSQNLLSDDQKELWEARKEVGIYETRKLLGNPFPGETWTTTSRYGWRWHPIYNEVRKHNGIDIAKPSGTPVTSVMPGIVTAAAYDSSRGNYVTVTSGDDSVTYEHLQAVLVSVNQVVDISTIIGQVGSTGDSTGSHLHIEYKHNGTYYSPEIFVDGFAVDIDW